MGAPIFTEAELRRAMKVAGEFGAIVEICPRRGTLRLVPADSEPLPSLDVEGQNQCDELFGAGSS